MESDSGESTGGLIDLSQLSKFSAASPAVLCYTQQSSNSCCHDATSGADNQGEIQGSCEYKEATRVAGTDSPTQPPTVGWHDESPLKFLGNSQEFSLIEDEKFDFLIPDEYLDESLDGSDHSSGQHMDSRSGSRIGGIMACSSPISLDGCPKQSIYEKALLQLKYRGRADLILHQHCYRREQPKERVEEEEEGEAGPPGGSANVPEEIVGEDSLHEEAGALDIASSFGEEEEEDNSHCKGSGDCNSSSSLLIDLDVSPSAPPPKLNSTVTLNVDVDNGLEGEGVRQWQRNTTFTLIDCPFEVSTSAAVEEMANSGSNCTTEEEGQMPSRLPTLAKRTQPSLLNVDVESSDYAIMRDIWKEQMQTEQQGFVPDGGSTTANCTLASNKRITTTTTTTTQASCAAECTASGLARTGCPSSTFVKESSSAESLSSSPAKELEHNTTKTLGSDGSSSNEPLTARGSQRIAAHPRLAYPKGKSQLSTAPKIKQLSQEQNTTVTLKGARNHNLAAVPKRPKSILKTPKRHVLSQTQVTHEPYSSTGAKGSSDATIIQRKKNSHSSRDAGSEEKQHKPTSLHKPPLDAPTSFSVSTVTAGLASHYQSTPMATPKCVQQPFNGIQPNFSLSSIEGSDPGHRQIAAQKTITPHSQNRRRSGIPTSASSDRAPVRPMSAHKPQRTRDPDPSLSPQLPKAPPMRKSLHQPKAFPRIALHDKNGPSSTARGPLAGKAKVVRSAGSGAENRRRSKLAVPAPKGQSAV